MFKLKNRFYLIVLNGIVSGAVGLLYSYFSKMIYQPRQNMPQSIADNSFKRNHRDHREERRTQRVSGNPY